ncbi:MAG: HNH endonuclease [Candidatus Heimdallarchaeota archaeon]
MAKQLKLFPTKKEKDSSDPIDWRHHRETNNEKVTRPKPTTGKRKFWTYKEYIKSDEWKIKRAFALNRTGHRCEKCGSQYKLEVHHKTYDNLYKESPKDLEVLCAKCHTEADEKRAAETRYENAFNTYASKVHGEDWAEYMDADIVEEEFQNWLDFQDGYGEDW